jgi:hypothetical protein
MFEVVVSLEESISGKELYQDTPDTPDVTGETPAQIQNNLWCPIVTGGHNRRVVFIIKCGRAKVNETNLTVEKDPSLARIAGVGVRGGRDGAVVSKGLVGAADEEDVFGFQIGVDEIQVVED